MNAPTRTSRELVWPPPQEELDALEVVLLQSPAPPSTTDAPLALAPVVEPTPVPPRSRVLRIATVAVLMLVAMMVGVWLGALHARRSIAAANFAPASPAPAREPATAAPERVEAPPSSLASSLPAPVSARPSEPAATTSDGASAPSAPIASSPPASPPNAAPVSTVAPPAAVPAPPVDTTAAAPDAASVAAPSPSAASIAPPSTEAPSTPSASIATPSEVSPPSTPLPEAKAPTDLPGGIGAPQPLASPPARRAEAARIPVTGPDEAGVKRTLAEYQRAFDTLDANVAAARWPSVDVAALARAFSSLKSQALVFNRCQFLVGTSTAMATCTGSTTVVRQVGSARPVTEPLQWTFRLRRAASSDWVIDSVQTTR